MTYKDVYNMAVEDLMNMWNEFCLEHDREKLIGVEKLIIGTI